MKWFVCMLLLVALLLFGCSGGGSLSNSLDAITAESVRAHMLYLASDSLKGRNTPGPELDTAAAYIAGVFARSGLLPVGGKQKFNLSLVSLGEPNALTLYRGGKETTFDLKTDFTPFEMTANRAVRGQLVFAGYGISAPEYGYDDYAGIDVKGKVVLVLRHEPREEDSTSVFLGKAATDYSNVARKVRIARDHGAVALLVVTDPLNHTSLIPRGFAWPSLSRTIPMDALPLTLGADEDSKIPVVHVGEAFVNQVFGGVHGGLEGLKELQAAIDHDMKPRSCALPDMEVRVQTSTSIVSTPASNVIGYLEGSDPLLRKQIVVVGAHYDHVGYKKQHAPGEDYIYNGADDNGSGTVALLEIAAALGALPERPRRTILLIAFAGEEKGLFGSEYYAREPLFPLDSTVAMLNMDMVGRNSPDSLQLIGAASSPDLGRIVREENSRVGFVLRDEVLSSGGSDHMSFQKRNVPALFFHSGLHADYHKVSDSPDKIDMYKVARTARLVFLTAVHLANDTQRYRYIPKPISLF
jgi:hypothetical protein